MAKMSIVFDGFSDLAQAIDKAGGDLKEAVDEALTKTQDLVQENVRSAATVYSGKGLKGYATGAMVRSIMASESPEWHGSIAEVGSGFTTNGGATMAGFLHSIFVMYGTPKMSKDQKLYNAIKGTRTRKQIAELQQEVMNEHLKLGGG
jgi:hypothetical protein